MSKANKVLNSLGEDLGYNPYRDSEGKFDDGPNLLATRGRPKVAASENRRKIDEQKEKLRQQYQLKDTKPERDKVLDGPTYIETPGFAINERNLASDHIRTTLWRDKELMPGQTYGEYYETNKAKKGDIFMMTPAEYRQALIESGQYKDIEGIERRMDWDKVDQYTEDMQSGDKFPPPALYYDEDGSTSQEGLHRIFAAERVGIDRVPVMVDSDTRNQDIYPYNELTDNILSQEEIFSGREYGSNGDDDDGSSPNNNSSMAMDDSDSDDIDNPAIEATFYGISALGGEHHSLLERKKDKSLTFSEEEAINAELKANEKNIKQETDKVLKNIKNSDYDNDFLVSLSTTIEQEQAVALENNDELYLSALDKIALAIGDKMVDEDGNSDDIDADDVPTGSKFNSAGQLTGNNIVTEAEAKKATANSAYKEIVYHGTVASSGQKIADEGFTASTGEGQWFGDGVYLTPNAIDAFVYGNSKATPDDPTVVTSSYIDVATFFDDDTQYWDMVRQDMIDKGLIKTKTENLKTFEQFEGFNTSARDITQKLLSEYEGVKIPGDGETRDSYIIVSDPSKIKTYSVAEGQMAKQKYFDDIAKPKPAKLDFEPEFDGGNIDGTDNTQAIYDYANNSTKYTLDDAQAEAIQIYADAGHVSINDHLRNGKPSAYSGYIETIDQAIERGYFERDTILYRGADLGSEENVQKLIQAGTFTDKGYSSTSLSQTVAADFSKNSQGSVIFRIHKAKGDTGLLLRNTNSEITSAEEFEVLLPRETRYTVIYDSVIEIDGRKVTMIGLE